MSGFNDEQAVNEDGGDLIVASIPLQDFTIGDGINATTTSCVLDKQRRLGSVASHYPSHCHLPPKDISLAEVEVMFIYKHHVFPKQLYNYYCNIFFGIITCFVKIKTIIFGWLKLTRKGENEDFIK